MLHPVVRPVPVGGHAVDGQIETDTGGRLLQQGSHIDRTLRCRRCVHHQALADQTCSLQEEFCALRVVRPLRQIGQVIAITRMNGLVVGERGVAAEERLARELAIEEVLHRENKVRMAGRTHVLAHDEVRVQTRFRFLHGMIG